MAPIAPGALAESASAKMRFLYSAEYWRRLALTTTSGSGIVLASPGATLRSAPLLAASLRSAPGEAKTTEGGGTPFTDFLMSISFSALYTKSRKGTRLTDLATEGRTVWPVQHPQNLGSCCIRLHPDTSVGRGVGPPLWVESGFRSQLLLKTTGQIGFVS